jgi:hypothetical protein
MLSIGILGFIVWSHVRVNRFINFLVFSRYKIYGMESSNTHPVAYCVKYSMIRLGILDIRFCIQGYTKLSSISIQVLPDVKLNENEPRSVVCFLKAL